MIAKGSNDSTGNVHYAKTVGHWNGAEQALVQRCGASPAQLLYLTPVAGDVEVTCKRCLANPPKATPARVPAPAVKATGSTTWGVYDATGALQTWRTTKREALAAAERIGGGTVAKI